MLMFALMIATRRMTAFVTPFDDRLSIPNGIVSMMAPPVFRGMDVAVGCSAALRRLTVSRQRRVMGAAAEDTVR